MISIWKNLDFFFETMLPAMKARALKAFKAVGGGEKGYHFGGDGGDWSPGLSLGAFPS